MAKQNNALEWKVLLSDDEWKRVESLNELLGEMPGGSMTQNQGRKANRIVRLWVTALMALVVIGTATYSAGREAQAGPPQPDEGIASIVEANSGSANVPGNAAQVVSGRNIQSESWAATPAERQAEINLKLRFRTEWDNIMLENTPAVSRQARIDHLARFRTELDNIVTEVAAPVSCRALLDLKAKFRVEWDNIPAPSDGTRLYGAGCLPH